MYIAVTDVEELSHDHPAGGFLGLAERGLLPDALVRQGIRWMCRARLRELRHGGCARQADRYAALVATLQESPVAIHVDAANAQHYELPAQFFAACLGKRLKYSGAYYPRGEETLDQAEEAMLALYGERAALEDGQRVLELGCGWGSLTLWMAERYRNSQILAVSNSSRQRAYIQKQCQLRGLSNVQLITQDVNSLRLPDRAFDRCVSIEMFEHMRNYATLMQRIGACLCRGGKLFVHIFAHRELPYCFETAGAGNWMGRHFFTGGLMPAADTLLWFQGELTIEQRWLLDGTHYQRTANHWLANQDAHREIVMDALREAYGAATAPLWYQRWRLFWMACAELFGYAGGQEWLIAHYRFSAS